MASNFENREVEALLDQGCQCGAFPGAVAMWGHPSSPQITVRGLRGLSRNALPVSVDLLYDLASLTKVLVTSSLAMIAVTKDRLDLNQPLTEGPLSEFLPWKGITAEHLLAHQSGLPAWRAFHRLPVVADKIERRNQVLSALSSVSPETPPGRKTIYSDLNFLTLGFLLEEVFGEKLDALFRREIADPLNLPRLGYRPLCGHLAPTEDGFRWGGPIGDSTGGFRGPVPLGRAHDDNAAYLSSVAGHAGLFGDAESVWALACQWSLALKGQSRIFTQEILADFLTTRPTVEDIGRPLGFNVLSRLEGLRNSRLSLNSFGHTGYTGPALWWDSQADFIWLFLCNRVHPHASNPNWRPGLYQGGPILNR